ncbi:MAG: NUDIX domain-containing protein [Sulfobacillus sp.]
MKQNLPPKKRLFCLNCGKCGHHQRFCYFPVISCGIIAVRKGSQEAVHQPMGCELSAPEPEFLMVQRRFSPCYTEIVRGRYDGPTGGDRHGLLSALVEGLAKNEREWLLRMPFERLWKSVWCYQENHENELPAGKQKFLENWDRIFALLKEIPSQWAEPEWGFPKGRREPRENDLDCARREFFEETGLDPAKGCALPVGPFQETFVAENGKSYRHIYFALEFERNSATDVYVSPLKQMSKEIRKISWMTFTEASAKLRKYHPDKYKILSHLRNFLLKK